ncbi:TfuA-like protein [Streptomyces cavernae]|uniref:TfuA-like protein n=1 Tax=Streptomyces cavernae TaxID=2259034 RepID=UPI00192E50C6|nr:TfuA-like protein [Streptomyces cavernae]
MTELVLDREPPAVIGIVDGLFEQVPTVWHKEILYALSKGVRVFGASSMGALRAAELHTFGMEGVGRVFEGYRALEYEDDDEVTLVHAPADEGYRPLSEAMVNIRAGLGAARDAGLITSGTCDLLTAAAKRAFYPERSWGQVLKAGRDLHVTADELEALRDYVRANRPDVKRDDALAMLTRIRQVLHDGTPPHAVDGVGADGGTGTGFDFESTYYWEKLLRVVRQQRAAREAHARLGTEPAALHEYVAAHEPDAWHAALHEVLSAREADRLGLLFADQPDGRASSPLSPRDEALVRHWQGDMTGPLLDELGRRGLVDAVRSALGGALAEGWGSEKPAETGTAVPQPSGRRE